MEAARRNREAGGQGGGPGRGPFGGAGGGPFGGDMTAQQRDEMRKRMLDSTSPELRALFERRHADDQ